MNELDYDYWMGKLEALRADKRIAARAKSMW